MLTRRDGKTITYNESKKCYDVTDEANTVRINLNPVTATLYKYFPKTEETTQTKQKLAQNEIDRMAGIKMHEVIETLLVDNEYCPLSEELKEEFFVEILQFEKFYKDFEWYPHGDQEFPVQSLSLKISGVIDFLSFDEEGNVWIIDWKRTRNIYFSNNGKMGTSIFSEYEDCNYNHYTIQLNLYRHILEKEYLINGNVPKVRGMSIVCFHSDVDDYERHDIPVIDVSGIK